MVLNICKLQLELARHEMSTADLARATGYSLNTIREYVNQKRNPTTKAAGKIAKALGVDVTEIIETED